jgi:hypothetical protein
MRTISSLACSGNEMVYRKISPCEKKQGERCEEKRGAFYEKE